MVRDLHHVGIIVKNLDRSLDFYVKVLGGKLLYISGAESKDVAKEVDVPGARTRLAVFKIRQSDLGNS